MQYELPSNFKLLPSVRARIAIQGLVSNADTPPQTARIASAGGRILAALLLALTAASPARAQDAQSPVKIGVLAKRSTEKCLEKWGATADYLTSQISGHFFTIVPLGFDEHEGAVVREEVDFILVGSSYYVGLETSHGANRIATLKNKQLGKAYTILGGVIFRRADREDIQDLDDLKGKTFMAVNEDSLGSWMAAWRELKEIGIDPYSDFADLRFGGSLDAVVYAVRDGKVDAGTVRTDMLERMAAEGKIRLEDFYVLEHDHVDEDVCEFPFLHSTDIYPEWPIAKLKHTSNELAEKVAVALIGMPADCPAAQAAQCAGWTVALNYQSVHECLKELRVGPYKDYGKITLADMVRQYWPWMAAGLAALVLMIAVTIWMIRLNRNISRTQSALRESEERLQTIQDSVQAGVVLIDAETHVIVDANPAALKMAGVSKQSVVGRVCHGFVYPEEEGKCPITDLGQEVDNSERVLVGADGQTIPILKTVTRITLNDREHLLESFVDITDRKRAENELRESNKRFEHIARSSGDWIWEVDTNARYTYASGRVKEILGYDPEEIIGKRPVDLMPEEEAKHILETTKDTFAAREPLVDLENWNLTKDGKLVCLLTNGVPILDENGQLLGYRGVDKDITNRKRDEDVIKQTRDEAEASAERAERTRADMERMNVVMMGREERVLEMKQEVNDLLVELGRAGKYQHV